jgi:hypothetical protein
MVGAYLGHGLLPLREKSGAFKATLRALELGQRGVVVLALLGVDDPQSLGTPQPRREVGTGLLKLLATGSVA